MFKFPPQCRKYLDWREADGEFIYTLAGSRIRHDLIYDEIPPVDQIRRHAAILAQHEPSEETFEWIDLFEAVDAARDRFTMIELGAGIGPWLVAGATVARIRRLEVHLVGVEAEHAHFKMLRQHFVDNGIDPDAHTLIKAAVTADGAPAYFTQGHSKEWWGQSTLPAPDYAFGNWPQAIVERTDGISLSAILAPLEKVDLIDLDIQGSEFEVLSSAKALLPKVARVHIGTHGREIEENLSVLFGELGWNCRWRFACHSTQGTEFGQIGFQDGVQSWINPASA
jgi:FkbM family methyltransferase